MYVWTTCRPPPGPPPGSVRYTAVSPPLPRTRSHTLRSFHVWPRRSWHVRTLIRWHFDTIGPLSREGARLHHTSPPCCRARPALRNLTRARHGLHNWAGLEGIGAHNWAADAYERFREAGALCRGRRVRRAPSPSRAARARTAPEPCPACTDVLLERSAAGFLFLTPSERMADSLHAAEHFGRIILRGAIEVCSRAARRTSSRPRLRRCPAPQNTGTGSHAHLNGGYLPPCVTRRVTHRVTRQVIRALRTCCGMRRVTRSLHSSLPARVRCPFRVSRDGEARALQSAVEA